MDCTIKTCFTRLGCSDIAIVDSGGQGYFYPGTWVAL